MKLAQAIALILIGAVSGSCITYIHLAPGEAPQHSKSAYIGERYRHQVTPKENCSIETNQTAGLPSEVKHLKAKLEHGEISGSPRNSDHHDREISLEQLRHQVSQIDSFRENIASLDDTSPLRAVKSQFQSQPIDYEWALKKEKDVLSLFEGQTALNNYSPLDVSCRGEMCQIVMAANTAEEGKAIYDAFLETTTRQPDNLQETSVSYFTDAENGQLVMYLSENGTESLFGQ